MLLVAVALLTSVCGQGDRLSPGDSLAPDMGLVANLDRVPVGQEWVTMNAMLINTSDRELVVRNLSVSGPGVGEVVVITRKEIGPITDDPGSNDHTGGGIFRIYPPAEELGGRCVVQRLEPMAGYVLRPGAEARVMFLTKAIAPGRYRWDVVDVVYRQDGELRRETLDFGQRGTVVPEGPDQPPITDDELRCGDPDGVLASGRPS